MNRFTTRCWGVNKREPPSKLTLARMVYRTYIPRPPLSEFVDLFWWYEGYDPHTPESAWYLPERCS